MTVGALGAIRRPTGTGTGQISAKQAATYLIVGKALDAIAAGGAVTYLVVRP